MAVAAPTDADIRAYLAQKRRERLKMFSTARPVEKSSGGLFSFLPDPIESGLGVVGKAAEQIGTSLIYSPLAMIDIAKGVGEDELNLWRSGDPFKILSSLGPLGVLAQGENTHAIGKAMATSMYEDFRHPLRNPGYLAMDVAGLLSGGTGLAARAGRVGRALEATRGYSTIATRALDNPVTRFAMGDSAPTVSALERGMMPHFGIVPKESLRPSLIDTMKAKLVQRSQRMRERSEALQIGMSVQRKNEYADISARQGAFGEATAPPDIPDGVPAPVAAPDAAPAPTAPALVDLFNQARQPNFIPPGVDPIAHAYNQVRRANPAPPVVPRTLPELPALPDAPAVTPPSGWAGGADLINPELRQQLAMKPGAPQVLPEAAPWAGGAFPGAKPVKPVVTAQDAAVEMTSDAHKLNLSFAESSQGSILRDAERKAIKGFGTKKRADGTYDVHYIDKEGKPRSDHVRGKEAAQAQVLRRYVDTKAGDYEQAVKVAEQIQPHDAFAPVAEAIEKTAPVKPRAKKVTNDIAAASAGDAKAAARVTDEVLDEDLKPRLGTRGSGSSLREMGISNRQLSSALKEKTVAEQAAIRKKVERPLKELFRDQAAQGKKPTQAMIRKTLIDAVGKEDAALMMSRIFKARGGSGEITESALREGLKAFFAPHPRTSMRLETKAMIPGDPKAGTVTTFADEFGDVMLPSAPFARAFMTTVYGAAQMLDNPAKYGGKGNMAHRLISSKIKFHQGEIERIVRAAEAAGLTPDEKRMRELEQAGKRTKKGDPVALIDTTNKLAAIFMLFMKPAYLTANALGQTFIALADHDWNPASLYRAAKIQNQLYKDSGKASARVQRMRGAMQDAMMTTLGLPQGAFKGVDRVHTWAANQYGRLLDTPWRDNAFINEAWRQGFKDADSIGKLLDAEVNSPEWHQFIDIARRANRNAIDYGRLTAKEKSFVRRMILFYPWMKNATIYGGRFATQHPIATTAIAASTHDAEDQAGLGMVPSFMRGQFKVGETTVPGLGKVPLAANPAAASVLGTPGDVLNMGKAIFSKNESSADDLSEIFSPALSAFIAASTKRDAFTGADLEGKASALDIGINTLKDYATPLRFIKNVHKADAIQSGELDPGSILYPGGREDAYAQQLGPGLGALVGRPWGERAVNPRELRSRAVAENRSSATRREAHQLNWKDRFSTTQSEAKRLGIDLPKEFKDAMKLQANRDSNIAEWEAANGKADQYQRLTIDLQEIVRMKKMSLKDAKRLLSQMAEADDNTISNFRRDLGRAYFGRDIVTAYRSILTASGADIPSY